METVDRIREIALNLLQDKEIELVDLTYRREGPKMVLRLIVDKKDGITIDECGMVNEALGELLDKENFLNESYILEVSSPGLDRVLKRREDFDRVKGSLVKVHTYIPLEGKREHVGKVINCDDEHVLIELKDTAVTRKIPLNKISKAQLEIEF